MRTAALWAAVGIMLWVIGAYIIPSAPISTLQPASALIVVDGDTVRAPYGVKYRLLGFDTPEISSPKCAAELELGQRATARLKELIASGETKIIESGRLDRYGRTLATLTVNGRDVGPILISEGLARAYDGRRRGSWCAQ